MKIEQIEELSNNNHYILNIKVCFHSDLWCETITGYKDTQAIEEILYSFDDDLCNELLNDIHKSLIDILPNGCVIDVDDTEIEGLPINYRKDSTIDWCCNVKVYFECNDTLPSVDDIVTKLKSMLDSDTVSYYNFSYMYPVFNSYRYYIPRREYDESVYLTIDSATIENEIVDY